MNYQRLGEISQELFFGGKPDKRMFSARLTKEDGVHYLEYSPLMEAFSKFNAELIALVRKWEENPDDREE
jgi:hypothetical protein